jgi:hypothetical protein
MPAGQSISVARSAPGLGWGAFGLILKATNGRGRARVVGGLCEAGRCRYTGVTVPGYIGRCYLALNHVTSAWAILAFKAAKTPGRGLGFPLLLPAFLIQFPQVLRADRRQYRDLIPDPIACLLIVDLRPDGPVVPGTRIGGALDALAILTFSGKHELVRRIFARSGVRRTRLIGGFRLTTDNGQRTTDH